MLLHNEVNLSLHLNIVYPVTLLILQSFSLFGWLLVIPFSGNLENQLNIGELITVVTKGEVIHTFKGG